MKTDEMREQEVATLLLIVNKLQFLLTPSKIDMEVDSSIWAVLAAQESWRQTIAKRRMEELEKKKGNGKEETTLPNASVTMAPEATKYAPFNFLSDNPDQISLDLSNEEHL